jgi:hypothetical protein
VGIAVNRANAVIYHYFEKDATYKENLIFFLTVGIHDEADYFIVISGNCSLALPTYKNVTYIRTENWNNDFGGYIKFVSDYFPNPYTHFIFINSSVRGPFLPDYSEQNWIDIFVSRLRKDVHLVGASINTLSGTSSHSRKYQEIYKALPSYSHVQTTAYALTAEAMQHLISIGFYDVKRELSKKEVIASYELRMSHEIIKKGWNISTILPVYNTIDYRDIAITDNNFSSVKGDVLYKGSFFGRTLSPIEAMFVKVNRDMISHLGLASYTFTTLRKHIDKAATFPDAKSLLDTSYQDARKLANLTLSSSIKSTLCKLLGIRK